jgi:hypothetical protein
LLHVSDIDDLIAWLKRRSAEELAGLLDQRPHLLRYGSVPRNLPDLARQLLDDRYSYELLHEINRPEQELLTSAARLTQDLDRGIYGYPYPASRPVAVADLLTAVGGDASARTVLDGLRAKLLLLPAGPDRIRVPALVRQSFVAREYVPATLDRALTSSFNKAPVMTIAEHLGIDSTTRIDAQRRIVAMLSDQGQVRALISSAPDDARQMLGKLLSEQALLGTYCFELKAGRYSLREGGSGDPDTDWLARRGLLVPAGRDRAEVPLEVARVLGGPGSSPFTSEPPRPATVPVPLDRMRGEAQSAAATADNRIGLLLKTLAREPATLRKSGGLAVRETRRLAKALGVDEDEARFWIDLCEAASLLGIEAPKKKADYPRLLPTPLYDDWLKRPPGERLASVIAAWATIKDIVTWWPENGENPVALAGSRDPCAVGLRGSVLRSLAALPPGTGLSPRTAGQDLAEAAAWHRPMCVREYGDERVWATLLEAQLLAVSALGMLTETGHVVLEMLETAPVAGPERQLETGGLDTSGSYRGRLSAALNGLLPPPQTTARFQADLTAIVSGTPAPELASLLDSIADRESEGQAQVWRFAPASVRRGLDGGADATDLLERLTGVSRGALPQPLEYLIRDTARKHGSVRVVRSACCLRSDDESLVLELSQHRALRKLGLRRIAPTVLISAQPIRATLEALRSAGYSPALEAATGATEVERIPEHRAPARPQRPASARRGRTAPTSLEIARRLHEAR